MERFVLTDAQWAKMEPHCLGKPTDPGRSGSDNRRFVEAVLWIVRTGSPWNPSTKSLDYVETPWLPQLAIGGLLLTHFGFGRDIAETLALTGDERRKIGNRP